jgi:hypothetical protein
MSVVLKSISPLTLVIEPAARVRSEAIVTVEENSVAFETVTFSAPSVVTNLI